MLKILQNSPCPPASTLISYKDACEQVEPIIKRYFPGNKEIAWPIALQKACDESQESLIALGLSLVFLDKLLLADTSIPISTFEWNKISEDSNLDGAIMSSINQECN